MPLLHMQVEVVRYVSQLINQFAVSIQEQSQVLSNAIYSLETQWQGSASEQFIGQIEPILQLLQQYSDVGNDLRSRLLNEIAQWEETALTFGDFSTSEGAVKTGDQGENTAIDEGNVEPLFGTGTDWVWGTEWQAGEQSDDDNTGFEATLWNDERKVEESVINTELADGLTIGAVGYAAAASGSLGFNDDGLFVKGDASVEAYVFKGGYEKDLDIIKLKTEAQLGAKAVAEGEVEINPLEGDLEFEGEVGAFAGVNVEGEVSTEIGPVGGAVVGEIGYGVGAEASVEAGFDDWKFNLDFGASAYMGVGGGVDFSVELDLPELAEDVIDIGKFVVDDSHTPWHWF